MSDTVLVIVLSAIGIGIGFSIGMLVSSLRHTNEGEKIDDQTIIPLGMEDAKNSSTYQESDNDSDMVLPGIDSRDEAEEQEKNRIRLNPIEIFTRAFQSDVHSPSPYDRSISEQIDEILQEMLEDSPLKSRAIRLMELPTKGMVVMVGLNQYQGVDTVPDEDVRNIIHAAVAEWEQRVTEDGLVQNLNEA